MSKSSVRRARMNDHHRKQRAVACLAVGATLALTASACGSSSSTNSSSGASATGASTKGAPIKIAFLGFESGSYATPDRHNSLELAINQINATGGVDGHKVQYTAYDTGILPQGTVTAAEHAIADKPTVIIGMQVSSGVQAAEPALKASGIPTLQVASNNSTDFTQSAVPNLFRLVPTVWEESTASARYILSKHPKTVGLFDDSGLNQVAGMKNIRNILQSQGVTNFVYREIAQNATDATAAALAMKGTDVIASSGFPSSEALFVKQLQQNGINTQDVMSYGAQTVVAYKLAPAEALANDTYQNLCDPPVLSTPQAQAFTSAYKAAFPSADITSSAPYLYDAVEMIVAAVKQDGGNLSAAKLASALESLTYQGACGAYHSDKEHDMLHSMSIISANGTNTSLATYTDMASAPSS